jgi:isoquinoline 1-oxidoreductase beta subunit
MNAQIQNEYYPDVILEQLRLLGRESVSGPVSRRGFLKASAAAGGGLLIGFGLLGSNEAKAGAPGGFGGPPAPLNPSAYVKVGTDGKITLYSKNPEIGQSIKTAFGMILAEELDAKWSDVTVEQAPVDARAYPMQLAGGSLSIPLAYDTLRQAGGAARAMLVAAAAKEWGVPASEITTSEGVCTHAGSRRSMSYGQLATAAAAMPVPAVADLKLKDKKDFKIMGTRRT